MKDKIKAIQKAIDKMCDEQNNEVRKLQEEKLRKLIKDMLSTLEVLDYPVSEYKKDED